MRTGSGFDVHAFGPRSAYRSDTIRLGGIDIPHSHQLIGHSDADVVLHALTDALLGALGAGDIGRCFPPGDPQWKDADSAIFVRHALGLLAGRNGKIMNADITIICEAPKIGPHADVMRSHLAQLLRVQPDQVNVKATTTEQLGFTGRGEGIAAMANVLILLVTEHGP